MPNFYEMLKIQPQATLSEIQAVLDKEYDKWRRLVTHHDPAIVEQANKSLRLLEKIRSTLTDTVARDAYDAGLGLKSEIDGLADPETILHASPQLMLNVARQSSRQEQVQTTIDAWVCGNCKKPNRIGLKFCAKCGTQIARECVCNQMVSVADPFCPYCGVDIAKGQAKLKAQQQELERQREMEEAARVARQIEFDRRQNEQVGQQDTPTNIGAVVLISVIFMILAAILSMFFQLLLSL